MRYLDQLILALVAIALNIYGATHSDLFPELNWIMVGFVIGVQLMVLSRRQR